MSMDLPNRVDALENALLTLGRAEFGDSEGHAFHGNQWTKMSQEELDKTIAGAAKELARRQAEAAGAAGVSTNIEDHLLKAPREAAIVDKARALGMIPEKGTHVDLGSEYGASPDSPAYILPTQTKIHLANPDENPYPSHDNSYVVVQSNETGHLRAIGGSGSEWNVGGTVHLKHDQTDGRIGGYDGHTVVGRIDQGTAVGVIPDRKIAYSVFK